MLSFENNILYSVVYFFFHRVNIFEVYKHVEETPALDANYPPSNKKSNEKNNFWEVFRLFSKVVIQLVKF